MSFDVPADAYARFMGRFSSPLAEAMVARIGSRIGQQVLDVGCGPGALTRVLLEQAGTTVIAVDPSPTFIQAVHAATEVPAAASVAESLPFIDHCFDSTLAQLVVHFMADPVVGLREMARVTTPGGTVAASVWDHAGGGSPLTTFWRAATALDPNAPDESGYAGATRGQLQDLATAAGLVDVIESELAIEVEMSGFDEWWEPFTLGVGPAGKYVNGLDPSSVQTLRARCRDALPDGPFTVRASAWLVVASA